MQLFLPFNRPVPPRHWRYSYEVVTNSALGSACALCAQENWIAPGLDRLFMGTAIFFMVRTQTQKVRITAAGAVWLIDFLPGGPWGCPQISRWVAAVAPAQELAQNASRLATILAQILEHLPNAELCAEEEPGRRNGQTHPAR